MKRCSYVTMDDIAKRLKVSAVTVSKVFREHPDISHETARKVKKVAQELGYVPNYFARNIASNQSRVIGVILPNVSQSLFAPLVESMYQSAHEKGYEIILKISEEDAYREKKLIESLLSMRVDGIVISVTKATKDNSVFRQINKLGVALTLVDNVIDEERFYRIPLDYCHSAYTATEIAIKAGYRKFLYISEKNEQFTFRNGRKGFQAALIEHDLMPTGSMEIESADGEKHGYDAFIEYLKSGMIPECIFCSNWKAALGIYKTVVDVGLRVLEDIDFIISGYYPLDSFFVQPIAYIELPGRELGKAAIQTTINNILGLDSTNAKLVRLPVQVTVRELDDSTGKYSFKRVSTPPHLASADVLAS